MFLDSKKAGVAWDEWAGGRVVRGLVKEKWGINFICSEDLGLTMEP